MSASAAPSDRRESALVLLLHNDLVLTVSRRGKPDDLGLPGGKVEKGEGAEEAAKRELFEETGIPFTSCTPFERVFEREDGTPAGRHVTVFQTFLRDPPLHADTQWFARRAHELRLSWETEPGVLVSWVWSERLLSPSCTFAAFNRKLFEAIAR